MKRLMTTLIFVLLSWTGLCLADGVTVSGTVTLKETQWGGDITSSIMQMGYQSGSIELLQNGTGRYSGTMADDAEDPWTTRYSFSGVAAGNYTLSFNITFRGVGFFYTKDITVGETDVTENIEARKDNRGAMQLTIKYGEWDGENWTNERPIANAAVTCTQTDIEGATPLSGTSNTSGEVQFLLAKDASLKYSFNVKADGYQDTTFTMAAFLENSMVQDGVEPNNTTVYMREKTLDFVTLSGSVTMAPEGTAYPDGIQLQLTNVRHQYAYTTPSNGNYSFENVPVGTATLELYDKTNIFNAGKVDNYTITAPENGAFTIDGNTTTFTQDITVTKVAASVKGTIKDVASLGSTPTITLTKSGETTAAYQAQAQTGGSFIINGVKAGTYTVGTTLAGYAVKNAPTVTIAENLADATIQDPLEFETADIEITFRADYLGFRDNTDYIYLNGAEVKLFASNADVTTDTPLATATTNEIGKFTLSTTGKLGSEYILYVTHEKIKPVSIKVSATKAIMANDIDFFITFELAPMAIPTPTFSVPAGEVEKGTKVTIACTTDKAKIHYTVDGSEPTAQSTEYKEAVVIDKDLTLKAIAFVDENKSEVATAAYTVKEDEPTVEVATPTFSVPAGEVEKGTKVTIACTTDKAKIHYTVDGSEPTAQSTEYKEAVVIDKDLTLKAIAFVGENKSEVATAAYTVKTANEELELANVNVYPNPSDGEFTLDLPVAATVEVFASTGVLRQRVEAGAGVMTLNIDRSGIYFLRITANGRTTVKRVVVR